jgi:hypothetical protein
MKELDAHTLVLFARLGRATRDGRLDDVRRRVIFAILEALAVATHQPAFNAHCRQLIESAAEDGQIRELLSPYLPSLDGFAESRVPACEP